MFVDLATYTQHALGAVAEHGFQVAWKLKGAARMGMDAAANLWRFEGRHDINKTRAIQVLNKHIKLAATLKPDSTMW